MGLQRAEYVLSMAVFLRVIIHSINSHEQSKTAVFNLSRFSLFLNNQVIIQIICSNNDTWAKQGRIQDFWKGGGVQMCRGGGSLC